MKRKVLVAGTGQLGSRYLQGMAIHPEPLAIWAFDPSAASLERAQQRWSEIAPGCDGHEIRYVQQLDELPEQLDLAILAATADVRPALADAIAARAQVKAWVLEKVLAQSLAGLATIQHAVGDAPAWVNTPMHAWTLYRHLRAAFGSGPIRASFAGFRGLASNAIHFIDLVSRWNGAPVTEVETCGLQSRWHPAKREGSYEVEGTLEIGFGDGSQLCLTSGGGGAEFHASIAEDAHEWQVFEPHGYAVSADGRRVDGAVEFQSALTSPMMAAIFASKDCRLPTLGQSIAQHTPYLSAMLAHWTAGDRADLILPIT